MTGKMTRALCGFLGLALLLGSQAMGEPVRPPAKNWVLIDVRTPEEYQEGHLPRAILIPHDVIHKQIGKAVPQKDTPILLYCASGMRSGKALQTLRRLGYTQAVNGGAFEDLRQSFGK